MCQCGAALAACAWPLCRRARAPSPLCLYVAAFAYSLNTDANLRTCQVLIVNLTIATSGAITRERQSMDPGEQGTAGISGRRRMVPFCTSAPDGARCAVAHDSGAARCVEDRIEKIVTDAIYAEFTMYPAPPSHAAWLPITRAGGCRASCLQPQSQPFIAVNGMGWSRPMPCGRCALRMSEKLFAKDAAFHSTERRWQVRPLSLSGRRSPTLAR
jgi:hypothetical protein